MGLGLNPAASTASESNEPDQHGDRIAGGNPHNFSLAPAFGRRGLAAEGRRQRGVGGYPPGLNLVVADSYRFVALCLMALCSVTLAVKF